MHRRGVSKGLGKGMIMFISSGCGEGWLRGRVKEGRELLRSFASASTHYQIHILQKQSKES